MIDKPIKNVLRHWSMTDNRIRGFPLIDQPDAFCKAGEYLTTSRVERIYTDDSGTRYVETRNSRYVLQEG